MIISLYSNILTMSLFQDNCSHDQISNFIFYFFINYMALRSNSTMPFANIAINKINTQKRETK